MSEPVDVPSYSSGGHDMRTMSCQTDAEQQENEHVGELPRHSSAAVLDQQRQMDQEDPTSKEIRMRRPTYSTIKTSQFLAPHAGGVSYLVKIPNVIVMIGLPARGKTYISRKLCRYLKWIGIRTKVFNLGDYRRKIVERYIGNEFFSQENKESKRILWECAQMAMEDMCRYLNSGTGDVGIFDATNTTRDRRAWVVEEATGKNGFRVFFVESVCDDPAIVEANIQAVKVNSPDYKGMDQIKAKDDFRQRIDHYRAQYQTLDQELDQGLSYIQVFNAGRSFYVRNIKGHVQSRVVYFLMNIHLMPRSIYFTRYARELAKYCEKEKVPDLRVWSSQKIRAVQTAKLLAPFASFVEHWKALDEIDAGICEGLTYEEIEERYPEQFAARDQDKYHYRYPSGESYEDLVSRLEPVIMELERQENVLVISHQAVLRCLLAYFLDKDREDLPYVDVPLHSVIKLTPVAYGCDMEIIKFNVDAVDTYRQKPSNVDLARSRDDALATVPPYPVKSDVMLVSKKAEVPSIAAH